MRPTSAGPGRALVLVYGILALAACARGGFEVATKFDKAPLAYSLALASGIIYAVATFALGTNRRWLAWPTVLIELVGVLVVGTLSFVDPGRFQKATVWSWFGLEYFLVPLVLPFLGLSWLRRSGRAPAAPPADGPVDEAAR
jgi:hypothetical protein